MATKLFYQIYLSYFFLIFIVLIAVSIAPRTVLAEDGRLSLKQGEKVTMNIQRADNEIIIVLNGKEVFFKHTEFDPLLADTIDLTSWLKSGENYLIIIGINTEGDHKQNPFHIAYKIVSDGGGVAIPIDKDINEKHAKAGIQYKAYYTISVQ